MVQLSESLDSQLHIRVKKFVLGIHPLEPLMWVLHDFRQREHMYRGGYVPRMGLTDHDLCLYHNTSEYFSGAYGAYQQRNITRWFKRCGAEILLNDTLLRAWTYYFDRCRDKNKATSYFGSAPHEVLNDPVFAYKLRDGSIYIIRRLLDRSWMIAKRIQSTP